jgi:hypothetical protein
VVSRSTRVRAQLLILLPFVGMIFANFLLTQGSPGAHAQAASTTHTSIRVGETWKGTETSLQGRRMDSITLTITAILPGQSDPIRGYWDDDRTLLFLGHEETYAHADPVSLTNVIKVWGRSPVDRYITFAYTGHWFGIMVEGRSGRLMGIEAELGGGEYYKFVLNKVSPAHIKRWVR